MPYEIKRFPYDGTIDADGHVLEPADLWETYLEREFQERALRIKVDENGLEYLEINGTPSKFTRNGSLGIMGAMGEESLMPSPERRCIGTDRRNDMEYPQRTGAGNPERVQQSFIGLVPQAETVGCHGRRCQRRRQDNNRWETGDAPEIREEESAAGRL